MIDEKEPRYRWHTFHHLNPAPEKKLQPPARWRNWWRVNCPFQINLRCSTCEEGDTYFPGDIINPCRCAPTYPSQEIAEIKASKAAPEFLCVLTYVGAYREGERP